MSFKSPNCLHYLSALASFICRVFLNLSQLPLWAQWLSLGSLRVKCFQPGDGGKDQSHSSDAFSKRALKPPRKKNANLGATYAPWIPPGFSTRLRSLPEAQRNVVWHGALSRIRHGCPEEYRSWLRWAKFLHHFLSTKQGWPESPLDPEMKILETGEKCHIGVCVLTGKLVASYFSLTWTFLTGCDSHPSG